MISPASFPGYVPGTLPFPLRTPPLPGRPSRTHGSRAVAETRGRTVLVVEDDALVRGVVAESLRDEGYTVLEAAHGRAAIDLLTRVGAGAVHLVLLDMRMPVMDGWDFAAAYRALPAATAPIVVMTAAQDAANWGQEIGAAATVGKPFEVDSLLSTVDRLIRR